VRKLWQFPGGLHLEGHKKASTKQPIRPLPIAPQLVLPLRQHIGEVAKPDVEVGQQVRKGQRIARCNGYISAPLHAPTSGTIVAIEDRPLPHPSSLESRCIIIASDGNDDWVGRNPIADYRAVEPATIRDRIRRMGIVGMGGAGFPSAVKLNPRADHPVDTLILNGAECEPYISCDDRLMRERADDIIIGLDIMRHILDAADCLIGIEDNKPEAIAAMRAAVEQHHAAIEVVPVPTRYPMGGEKQLIYTLTGREVPRNGIPAHVGVVCHNPGTAYAVYKAVVEDEPLLSRVLTVAGAAVPHPANYEVRLGTPMAFVLEHAGVNLSQIDQLLMGGPMMGIPIDDLRAPVTKTCNCLLARSADERPAQQPVLPCIRCSACADACPVSLLPQQMYWYARAKELDKVQEYALFDCIECGVCAAVCPSNIPLIAYFRFAKTAIYTQEREKQAADRARERHEFRLHRQQRDKHERQERLKKKKASVSGRGSVAAAKKKAVIEAAMARAKAKREVADQAPQNTDNLTPAQLAQIKEADQRRQAAPQDNND